MVDIFWVQFMILVVVDLEGKRHRETKM